MATTEALHDELYSGVHPLEVTEQWRVTGQPGPTTGKKGEVVVEWPHYDFTWTDAVAAKNGFTSAAEGARAFVARQRQMAQPWLEGPDLHRRLVAVTKWVALDG